MGKDGRMTPLGAWVSVITVVLLLSATVFVTLNWGEVKSMFGQKDLTTVNDTIVVKDTINVPTIEDILYSRRLTIESLNADSVFLSLPDVVLAGILMKLGTTAPIEDIVEEYRLDKDLYNNLQLGTKIQNTIILHVDSIATLNDKVPKAIKK